MHRSHDEGGRRPRALRQALSQALERRLLRGRRGAAELGAELADRAPALRDHVVVVDRLEVPLTREHEVAVVEAGHRREQLLERDADGVLDEARMPMRLLDDVQLVGPLQELVDRRAHRPLDDASEILGVEVLRGTDEERPAAALVVRRQRDELEDPLRVLAEPGGGEPLGRLDRGRGPGRRGTR